MTNLQRTVHRYIKMPPTQLPDQVARMRNKLARWNLPSERKDAEARLVLINLQATKNLQPTSLCSRFQNNLERMDGLP